jgi:serine phosphatase RsbU (regulator of sigma subunit)
MSELPAQTFRSLEHVQRELERAAEVQRNMLPAALPAVPGYSFWAFWEPAFPVGGDLYDFHTLPTSQVLMVVADVSGKGLAAALGMASLAGMIPLALEQTGTDLQSLVSRLNRTFCRAALRAEQFVTFIAVLLDPSTHRIQVVSAGSPTGLLRRQDGTIEDLCPNERVGLPLGVVDACLFEAIAFDLMPGDSVVIASDGITGAVNVGNEVYGSPRLNDVIARTEPEAGKLGRAVLESVKAFVGSHAVRDDVAMICFARDFVSEEDVGRNR